MKSPRTRRRQRRILEALTRLGPLSEHDLYELLGAYQRQLTRALLDLATEGRITVESTISLFGARRMWRISEPYDHDETSST